MKSLKRGRDCVGVRCGAHPLGKCGKNPVQKYAFRLASSGEIIEESFRLYCAPCAAGLKAAPYGGLRIPRKPAEEAQKTPLLAISGIKPMSDPSSESEASA